MKKEIYLIILLLTCRICDAQNLVPNGDFEQYSGCPTGYAQLDSTLFWMNPHIAPFPPGGTPDYYDSCAWSGSVGVPYSSYVNYQPAHSGGAYSGILTWNSTSTFREYIEVPLTSQLSSNACYHFEMYVNLRNNSHYAIDVIGAYFSDTLVTGISNMPLLPFTPQINNMGFIFDTLNWVLVSGNFTAAGGENYLIIGNFNNDANTNSIQVGSNGSGGSYYFIDDVSLTLCTDIDEQNEIENIKVYPNPAKDKLYVTINNKELSEIILYDITSRKILQKKFKNTVSLNTEQLDKGIYIYEVRDRNGLCKKGKVVKE